MNKILLFLLMFCAFGLQMNAQIWSDNFDDEDISDWTVNDIDGDGLNWLLSTTLGFGGTGCIFSQSFVNGVGAVTPNNYITSPAIDLRDISGAIAIDWKAYPQDQAWPEEKYKLVVSEAPLVAAIDAGDVVFEETLTATGAWAERTADLSAYAGTTIYLTFIHFESVDWFQVNIDDIVIYQPASDDVGITDALAPSNTSGCTFTAAETPTISIFNFGGNAITDFEVSYSVNGAAAVVETVSESIAPATSLDYTFSTPFDASALGTYDLEFTTALGGDSDTSNDNFAQSFTHSDAVLTVHVYNAVSTGHSWQVIDNSTGEAVYTRGAYAWDQEFFDDVCIFSDKCYSFVHNGGMPVGSYLEILVDGVQVAGDTDGNGVPAVVDVPAIGGGCAANEAAVLGLTSDLYHVVNDDATVTGVIRNFGSAAMDMVEMSYSVDGGAPVSETFSGLGVLTGGTYAFNFSTPVNIADLTEYEVEVNLMTVNGEADADDSNNSASTELVAISYVPAKATVAEEATGTWCQFCPRGAIVMDMMDARFGEQFIPIAVHNGDPMAISEYDTPFSTFIGQAYPTIVLDRANLDADPGGLELGPADLAYVEGLIDERLNTIAPLSIDVDVNYTGDGNMTIDLSSEFVAPLVGAFRYNVVITEDGVTGGSGYAQANAFSGGAPGSMDGYEALPDPVPANQMIYDHVATAILGGYNGSNGTIPASNQRGDLVSYTFDYQVQDLSKLPNMHVVAMVIDQVSGEIVNATSTSLFTTDVEDVLYDEEKVRVFPNPSNGQSFVEITLEQSAEVEMSVFNGTGQKVAERNYGTLAGTMVLPFDGQNMNSGMYYVNLRIGDKLITKKLILAK